MLFKGRSYGGSRASLRVAESRALGDVDGKSCASPRGPGSGTQNGCECQVRVLRSYRSLLSYAPCPHLPTAELLLLFMFSSLSFLSSANLVSTLTRALSLSSLPGLPQAYTLAAPFYVSETRTFRL